MEAEQLDKTSQVGQEKKKFNLQMEWTQLDDSTQILGWFEHIWRGCWRKDKLAMQTHVQTCELSQIWPEHEASNHLFQLAAVVSSLLHYFIVGLVPGVWSIQFIIDMLLMISDRRFPESFERCEMETFGWHLSKYCSYDIKNGSVAETIHEECHPIPFLLLFPCWYWYVDSSMFSPVNYEYIF